MICNLTVLQINKKKWQKWPPSANIVLKAGFLSNLLHMKKENCNLNMFCKYQLHIMLLFFSKWRLNPRQFDTKHDYKPQGWLLKPLDFLNRMT